MVPRKSFQLGERGRIQAAYNGHGEEPDNKVSMLLETYPHPRKFLGVNRVNDHIMTPTIHELVET